MHRRRAHPNALWPSNSGPSTPRRVRFDPGMSDIYGLDHVQIAMPAGGEDAARAFYGALLGLPEIPKPPDLATRGGVWFMLGAQQLHLGVETAFQPARKAHPGLLTSDLPGLLDRCRAAGIRFGEAQPALPGYARARVFDPFGNRIELLQRL
jgi:catechol 2,3-dioxygenase-like lactoylglutathione lyase family enzyme